jgi:hypothetical protein
MAAVQKEAMKARGFLVILILQKASSSPLIKEGGSWLKELESAGRFLFSAFWS